MSEHCLRCFHKWDRTEAGCQHSNGWTLNTLKHIYFPMQISVSNLQICWLTAVNICLHLCCTPSALHCRMFVSVLISFPLSWPFEIKCNSSAEIQICIITRQPLSKSSWHHCHQAPARTWLTHGPFLLCDDNVSEWGCRNFSSDSRKILSLSGLALDLCWSEGWYWQPTPVCK